MLFSKKYFVKRADTEEEVNESKSKFIKKFLTDSIEIYGNVLMDFSTRMNDRFRFSNIDSSITIELFSDYPYASFNSVGVMYKNPDYSTVVQHRSWTYERVLNGLDNINNDYKRKKEAMDKLSDKVYSFLNYTYPALNFKEVGAMISDINPSSNGLEYYSEDGAIRINLFINLTSGKMQLYFNKELQTRDGIYEDEVLEIVKNSINRFLESSKMSNIEVKPLKDMNQQLMTTIVNKLKQKNQLSKQELEQFFNKYKVEEEEEK